MGRPLLIIATPQGQLGNSLEHFSHLRAFAEQKKLPLVHLGFARYADLFEGSRSELLCSHSPDRPVAEEPLLGPLLNLFKNYLTAISAKVPLLPPPLLEKILKASSRELNAITNPEVRNMLASFGVFVAERCKAGQLAQLPVELLQIIENDGLKLSVDQRMTRLLNQDKIVVFDGWAIRDEFSFPLSAESNRRYFTPLPDIRAQISAVTKNIRVRCDVVIGIHIRRGDYETWRNGEFFWPVERYTQWMSDIQSAATKKRVGFLVCGTDELNHAMFAGHEFELGPGFPVGDMYAFAQCDALLGPPSTFTSWAGFYGNIPVFTMRSATQDASEVTAQLQL